METRPSQQNKTIQTGPLNNFFTNVLNKNAFRMLFSLVSQVLLLLCRIAKAATAEGLTFSDPIHKKKFKSVRFLSFTKKTGSGPVRISLGPRMHMTLGTSTLKNTHRNAFGRLQNWKSYFSITINKTTVLSGVQ
jgi:hypothetical protein